MSNLNGIPTIDQTMLISILDKKFKNLKPRLDARVQEEKNTQIRKSFRGNGTYMIWGEPGIGKTDIIESVAKQHGFATSVFSLSLYDQVSLQGMPVIDDENKRTTFYPNAEMPCPEKEPYGVLFLDEFSSATRAVQTAAMRLALEGRLGSYVLPPGWFVICAGNLGSEDGAEVMEMPTPAANRMTHFQLTPNIDSFTAWATGAGINPLIVSFLNFNPKNLSNLSHVMAENEHNLAFASPRSWAALSEEIADIVTPDGKVTDWALLDIYASGTVGTVAATEFIAFARNAGKLKFNLADVLDKQTDKIMQSLLKLKPEVQYYVFTSLAVLIKQRLLPVSKAKQKAAARADIYAFLKAVEPMEKELIAVSIAMLRHVLRGEHDTINDEIIKIMSDEFPTLMETLLNLQRGLS